MTTHEPPYHPSCPWFSLYDLAGPPNVKWCEERLCALVNEPLNAWTNLIYVFIGLAMIYQGFKLKQRFRTGFGTVTFAMGVLSFVYHATNNFLTQLLDFVGMYLYVYFLLILSLVILKKMDDRKAIRTFALAVAVSTGLIPLSRMVNFPYQLIILVAGLAIIVAQIKIARLWGARYPKKYLIGSIIFFIIAAAFSYVDVSRIMCDPHNHFFQGHALWHLLSAVGVGFSYFLFTALMLKDDSYNRS